MTSAHSKKVRLTLPAYEFFGEGRQLPKRAALLSYMRDNKTAGRSTSAFAAFASRQLVTRDFAEAFVDFLFRNPRMLEVDVEHLKAMNASELFEYLFESPQHADIGRSYCQPNKNTDPSFRGVGTLVGAVFHSIFSLGRSKALQASEDNYLDAIHGPDDYVRHIYTEIGYSESKPSERLTPIQAMNRGRAFLNDSAEAQRNFVSKMVALNPDCIRYSLNDRGQKVGISAVYPITDAAFELTLQGERPMFSYSSNEIAARGNNLVLHALAEIYDEEYGMTSMQKRNCLIGGLLMQIARLIDTDHRRPIRAISYEVISSNTRRLRTLGFEPIHEFVNEGQPPVRVVAFDPMSRSLLVRHAMLVLDDFVWRVRSAVDQSDM